MKFDFTAKDMSLIDLALGVLASDYSDENEEYCRKITKQIEKLEEKISKQTNKDKK